MKVTGWTYWDDERYEDIPIEMFDDTWRVVAREMCERGYKFSGAYHQKGMAGVPIIDNKWKFTISQRSWGQLMVDAYPCDIDDSDHMGYVMWAWMTPDGEEMAIPKEGDYEA